MLSLILFQVKRVIVIQGITMILMRIYADRVTLHVRLAMAQENTHVKHVRLDSSYSLIPNIA
jgi:hypothetical protein